MKSISSLLLLTITLSATAQQHKKAMVMPLSTFSIGGSFQKFDGLNSRVAGLPQFKQLSDNTGTLGLGWLKENKRIISSGNITLGSSMSGHHDEKSSTIRYASIDLNLGYDVIKSEKIMLYPFVGLGYQGYQAIFFKDNSNVPFNQVLQSDVVKNAISSVRFNNSFFVYRAGIGFAVQSVKCPGSSIGFQTGFTGSFNSRAWKSNENQTLGNAPTDKISQFFGSIVFTGTPNFMNSK